MSESSDPRPQTDQPQPPDNVNPEGDDSSDDSNDGGISTTFGDQTEDE